MGGKENVFTLLNIKVSVQSKGFILSSIFAAVRLYGLTLPLKHKLDHFLLKLLVFLEAVEHP